MKNFCVKKLCLRKQDWQHLLMSMVLISLTGCLGTVVGTAVDVTLEVAKVPFKVAGAVVDVAAGNDEDDD